MNRLMPNHVAFIQKQPMFFVATAAAEGRVNVSPKGMDSLRVIDESRIVWLNLTGGLLEPQKSLEHRRVPNQNLLGLNQVDGAPSSPSR